MGRHCEAPGCPREAIYIAKGTDVLANEEFEDAVCQGCADYLDECSAAFDAPLKLTSLRRFGVEMDALNRRGRHEQGEANG